MNELTVNDKRQVDEQEQEYGKAVDELAVHTDELVGRLVAVTYYDDLVEVSEQQDKEERSLCPLAASLKGKNEQLKEQTRKIIKILRALEV